jgi:hypothetical protein
MKKPAKPWWKSLYESLQASRESRFIEDRMFWLPNKNIEWYEALEAIDKRRDPQPLLKMFAACVPKDIHPHIVDLFSRYQLRKKRGRPPTALYDKSIEHAMLWIVVEEVKWYVWADKMRVEDALAKVSKEYSVPPTTLENGYYRKQGSLSRIDARWKKARSILSEIKRE